MMTWKSDHDLMTDSLKKAYRLRETCDDRFEKLLAALQKQDEMLRRPAYQN